MSMTPTHGESTIAFVQAGSKRRSAVACQRCKARKVRCSVTATGHPCTNCTQDDTRCEVLPRKKHARDRDKVKKMRALAPNARSPVVRTDLSPVNTNAVPQDDVHLEPGVAPTTDQLQRVAPNLEDSYVPSNALHDSTPDEGGNPASFAEAVQANSPFNNERLFYSGDRQGLVHSVMEICASQRINKPGPLWFEMRAPEPKKVWEMHDQIYLRSKGVFNLPSSDVCDALIRSYFDHVHPLLPIIDAGHFLAQYTLKGAASMNLLVLWSVFLAAANFASPDLLRTAGYASRKALKRVMYSRAKALYDSDYEDDKVCVVQAVTLLGFWYSDAEDRNGPWHWMGIAIGLCQVMGLHRKPRLAVSTPSAISRQRLFRRIWWSCFVRDRWLSVGLGRPMRINLEDCDVKFPSVEDLTVELEQLAPEVADRYLPHSMQQHAMIWVQLVRLSHVLGRILRIDYGLNGSASSEDDFRAHELELKACRLADDGGLTSDTSFGSLSRLQFEMLLEATEVILQRPAINFQCPPDAQRTPAGSEALQKARASAARTNHIIEKLINADMVQFLRPMSLTALIPAMQIHLLDCRSSRQLARTLAQSKLGECMMVVSELRNTYWGADFTYKLFEAAQSILGDSEGQSDNVQTPQGFNPDIRAHQVEPLHGDNGQGLSNASYITDGPDVFGETYNDALYHDMPDPNVVDPWSLAELQNMFDMPFDVDIS